MKIFKPIVLCLLLAVLLCSCTKGNSNTENSETQAETSETIESDSTLNGDSSKIIGTWICEDISDECYFIFDEKGDAFAKWGTCTVYGYYDYYEEDDTYDIDIPNFLYNEYEASFSKNDMILKSDTSSYTFEKAEMPKITIKAPDNLTVDKDIVGNWQSEDSYECYKFNQDGTATVTDLYNYATVDCKFTCDKGVVTLYSMASETKENTREMKYSLKDSKLTLDDIEFEKVEE